MSRVPNINLTSVIPAASTAESLVETKWEELARLNDLRNEFLFNFDRIMRGLKFCYQPFCLKDYRLYLNRQEFSHLLSSIDNRLSKMELLLQNADTNWKNFFDSEKRWLEIDIRCMNTFLSRLNKMGIDNSGIEYFKTSERYERELASKKNIIHYNDIREQLNIFIAKVDEYRRYFNAQNILPEVREIQQLISEAEERLQLENDPDPGHLSFVEFQMQQKVMLLEEAIYKAKCDCETARVSLEAAMKNLLSPPPPRPQTPIV